MGPSAKSVSHMLDSIAKEKKWGKKCLEIMSIKGGGVEGPTPNGKIHLKFPFWLFEPFPKIILLLMLAATMIRRGGNHQERKAMWLRILGAKTLSWRIEDVYYLAKYNKQLINMFHIHQLIQIFFFPFPRPFPTILGNDSHGFPFPKCRNGFFRSRPRTSGMELAIPIPVLKLPKVIPTHPCFLKEYFFSFSLFVLLIDIYEVPFSKDLHPSLPKKCLGRQYAKKLSGTKSWWSIPNCQIYFDQTISYSG